MNSFNEGKRLLENTLNVFSPNKLSDISPLIKSPDSEVETPVNHSKHNIPEIADENPNSSPLIHDLKSNSMSSKGYIQEISFKNPLGKFGGKIVDNTLNPIKKVVGFGGEVITTAKNETSALMDGMTQHKEEEVEEDDYQDGDQESESYVDDGSEKYTEPEEEEETSQASPIHQNQTYEDENKQEIKDGQTMPATIINGERASRYQVDDRLVQEKIKGKELFVVNSTETPIKKIEVKPAIQIKEVATGGLSKDSANMKKSTTLKAKKIKPVNFNVINILRNFLYLTLFFRNKDCKD